MRICVVLEEHMFWIVRQVEGGCSQRECNPKLCCVIKHWTHGVQVRSGKWEIAPDRLGEARCKSWVGICCYWQKGDISDT